MRLQFRFERRAFVRFQEVGGIDHPPGQRREGLRVGQMRRETTKREREEQAPQGCASHRAGGDRLTRRSTAAC